MSIVRGAAARRWAAAAAGAALVAAAWCVALVTPTEDDAVLPFVTTMQLGEQADGRNLAVTLLDVHRADSVIAGGWSADGNWIVIDLDAEAIDEESGALVALATLQVGGATYQASERPESLFERPLYAGLPQSGSLAFELPAAAVGGTAVLHLGLHSDPRLDTLMEAEFDLGPLPVESDVEMIPTGWSGR